MTDGRSIYLRDYEGRVPSEAQWTVDVITNSRNHVRLRFSHHLMGYRYLGHDRWVTMADNRSSILNRLICSDASPESSHHPFGARNDWAPIPVGLHFMLRDFFGDFLAADRSPSHGPMLGEATVVTANIMESYLWDISNLDPFLWDIVVVKSPP